MTNPNLQFQQFEHTWKNEETGELEPVSAEVYNAKRAALKNKNRTDATLNQLRGDKFFQGEW